MTKLETRIENALNEARILVLGAEVLVGFGYRAVLEQAFQDLPRVAQQAKLVSLALLLIALALLMAPAAYHRIVARGENTRELVRFTTGLMMVALLPFAVALGIDLYVALQKTIGPAAGMIAGVAGLVLAVFFWYGLEFWERSRLETGKKAKMMEQGQPKEGEGKTTIDEKIKHVLTEARMVLPGAQALLGFAFIATLMDSFDKLPASSKYVHLASLGLIAISTILFMTPSAYHRIVEDGEDTERFHRFASRMVLGGMFFLALGAVGDFYVVMRKVVGDPTYAAAGAIALLLVFYGLWFGYTLLRRGAEQPEARERSAEPTE